MGLLKKLTTTVLVPAALGAALLYAATHADDGDAQWLYVMGSWGVVMIMVAIAFGRIAYLKDHNRLLADQLVTLNRQVQAIENGQDDMQDDVDSHLLIKQWRQAGMTSADVRRSNGLRVIGEPRRTDGSRRPVVPREERR